MLVASVPGPGRKYTVALFAVKGPVSLGPAAATA